MLHREAIDTPTLELLNKLMQEPSFYDLRLVGGTALALQTGHRKSVDIDLFGKINFEELNVADIFSGFKSVVTVKKSININILVVNDIKVDFVNYSYPWLEPVLETDNIRMANVKDIAAMKLAAITGRGNRKDFIDIYFLLKQFSLDDLLGFYRQKYFDGSEYMVLKSLTYFEDADKDPPVQMLYKTDWDKVKSEIVLKVKKYIG